MARARRSPDPLRIAAAQITGTVDRCVSARQLDEDRALVQIGAALAALPDVRWPEALAAVAARYVDSTTTTAAGALALLVRAGADPECARAIKAARPGQGFLMRPTDTEHPRPAAE